MKEFRIIRQNHNARPFEICVFHSYDACFFKLMEIINNLSDCVEKDYYVFNDFYDNEYLPSASIKLKIECREVEEWETYSSEKNTKKYNKIIKIY